MLQSQYKIPAMMPWRILAITYLPVERSVSEITLAVCATLDKPPKAQNATRSTCPDIPGIVLLSSTAPVVISSALTIPALYSGANGHICCTMPAKIENKMI